MSERQYSKCVLFCLASFCMSVARSGESPSQVEPSRVASSRPDLDKYIQSVQSINGLVLGISILQLRQGTNSTRLPIGLTFKASGKQGTTLYIPKAEYLVRFKLYDSNDHALPEKEVASKYGSKFNDLRWDLNLANQPQGHPQMVFVKDTWTWGCQLPSTVELFRITEPGRYRLSLEVQVLLLYLHDKQVREVVRFPPVEVRLEHPGK